MRTLLLLALPAPAGASAAETRCSADADCPAGYTCAARKAACAVHPESSTCVERVCRRKPGGPVTDADRACKKDADCAIVTLQCECMYCARAGDYELGRVASVNKRRAKAYAALSECSKDQQRSCATAGPCAITGLSEARCRAGKCEVLYVPRSGR